MTNDKKVKVEFKHKRMPVGYMSAPYLEMFVKNIEIDKSQIIKIQPKLIKTYFI